MKKVTVILSPLFAIALVFTLLLSSCDIETAPLPTDVKALSPNNDQNPYDHFGQQHNEGVQYLLDNHIDEIGSLMAKDPLAAETLIFEKLSKKEDFDMKYHQELRDALGLEEVQTIESSPFLDLEKLLKTPPFNPYEMKVFQTIINDVTQLPNGTTQEMNTIIKRIISLEAKYLEDEEIENKEVFFGSLSVLRYSAFLWGNNKHTKSLRGPRWWKIAVADSVGFGLGTWLGGPWLGVYLGVGVSKCAAKILK